MDSLQIKKEGKIIKRGEVRPEGCICESCSGIRRYTKDCALKGDDEYGEQRKSKRIYAKGDWDSPGHHKTNGVQFFYD